MRKVIMFSGFLIQLLPGKAQQPDFNKYPVYAGNDLGLTYSSAKSVFKIWAPAASEAEIVFYKDAIGGDTMATYPMITGEKGTWLASVKPNKAMPYYAFRVNINGRWSDEVPDPYAKAVGLNGKRAMVVDLKQTNPAGWENDKSPAFINKTDAIIYELHVRDASIAANSGIKNKGKFLGLTEIGTKNKEGLSTGLDHLKEIGVTHIHLLPFYDYNSVDEAKLNKPQYNWGYDPLNYNTTEGSYATNAADGVTRIREFKKLVQAFHANGLRVVMDVVYNHTALTEHSYFNELVPGYYYRQNKDGKFSDATACGNETASERPMVRKFMLESMKYWVQEYHVDGFRVDLMGVHDIETMNLISKELHKIKPGILIYGEGWTAGASPLPDSLRALKKNAYQLDRIAVFSDDIRDGIKGSVFDHHDKGFANGKPGMEESIKFGVVASIDHPQIDYSKVNYSKAAYAKEPWQTISYAECHDNHVLWDKLAISAQNATEAERKEMHKLALSIVLTSQGISFLHAGTEFLRSKKGVENSYNSPDSINQIDWSLKTKNKDVVEYVKGLIKLRKEHPAFHMKTAKEIKANLTFTETNNGFIAYSLDGQAVKDNWKKIVVVYNAGEKRTFVLPGRGWKHYALPGQEEWFNNLNEEFLIPQRSCVIFYLQ
ncbi:MAG TPA: type I pullulanase [Chitinophagaceae bacterium]